jgi:hypothetical protein
MANKIKSLKLKNTFLGILIVFLFFCVSQQASMDNTSITNLNRNNDQKETMDKIKELEEKARTYQQIISIKQKQQATLENQISLIETEAERLQAEIDLNKGKIDDLNSQVDNLRNQINDKEQAMRDQKKILGQLIQKYYEYKNDNTFSVLLDQQLSSFTAEEDHLSQTGDKIKDMINSIESLKNGLEQEKRAAEDKVTEITDLYYQQQEKNSELESTKSQKEALSAQTQGEENRYQQLLTRVEAQKLELLGDIDQLYSSNTAAINLLASTLEKPKNGLASTSWYYSQKDGRWGNMNIGQSHSLVKDYGCALTSVAMVFTYYGEIETPATLAKQKIFYWDLIVWPNGDKVKLISNSSHGGLKWTDVDRELALNNPVIVFIKAKAGGAGHYVVIHHKVGSDYVVHDPYFGSNIFLSSSIKLLSALYKTSISMSSVDQMILYDKK